MKSINMSYVAPGRIAFREEEVPDPGFGEVQVRKLVCGLCAADLFLYAHGPQSFGNWPGHEGLSVVLKVGAGVEGLKEGDIVYGGGFASVENFKTSGREKIVCPIETPAHWIVEPAACVVNGMDQTALRVGDRVALLGCGYMGLMLAQLIGRTKTVESVAVDLDPERLEMALGFGMDRALNPGVEAEAEALAQLEGCFDVVIDATGVRKGLYRASSLLKRGRRLILFGWNHGDGAFPGDVWHLKGFTVVNAAPGSAPDIRDCFDRAVALLGTRKLDMAPLVTHVRPYSELAELLELGVRRTAGYIKGVVTYDDV